MSNEKKSATLGMPHGTATNRLRKNILFNLLKKHGENCCFKCQEFIDRVEDLSIEHKKPWEGISADLFWDLENIAFSHTSCNRPHRYVGVPPSKKIQVPEGFAWCSKHQAPLPINEFHKNSLEDDGVQQYCKYCRKHMRAVRPKEQGTPFLPER